MSLQLDSRSRQEPLSTRFWEKLGDHAPLSKPQPSTWVRLIQPPTAFSFDEAWLLCQYSETQWLAWIPDYGEILLNSHEFY
jgi:hypothetical protein